MDRIGAALIAVVIVASGSLAGVALADPGHGNAAANGNAYGHDEDRGRPAQPAPRQSQSPPVQQAQKGRAAPAREQSARGRPAQGTGSHSAPARHGRHQARRVVNRVHVAAAPGALRAQATKALVRAARAAKPRVAKRAARARGVVQVAHVTKVKRVAHAAHVRKAKRGSHVARAVKRVSHVTRVAKAGPVVAHAAKAKPVVRVTHVAAPVAPAPQKVAICRATGSASNPYVPVSAAASAVAHGRPAREDGRDVVPPFQYGGKTYSATWDAQGQALFANGCKASAPAQPARAQAPAPAVSAAVATPAAAPVSPARPAAPARAPSLPAAASPAAPMPFVVPWPRIVVPAAVARAAPTAYVLGTQHTIVRRPAAAAAAAAAAPYPKRSGVRGAVESIPSAVVDGTLPFTGFKIWVVIVVALFFAAIGISLWRLASRRSVAR